jgi:hypothetical protein
VNIIGVTGYAQNGKDTVGNILVEEYGYERLTLADPVKEAVLRLDPYIPDPRYYASEEPEDYVVRLSQYIEEVGPEEAKKHPEVRRLYQVMGTEVGRELLGEDIWIDAAEYGMVPGTNYVITDVRFPNEADRILELGGEVWRVVRLNPDGSVYDNGLGKDHVSEQHIAGFECDCLLIAKSVDELRDQVKGLME